jgi:hypothetical protein
VRFLKTKQLARVLGVPTSTLHKWLSDGTATATIDIGGVGNNVLFTISECVAICLGRGLRKLGWPLEQVGEIVRMLSGFSEDDLLEAFARGRDKLVCVDGFPATQLLSDDEIAESVILAAAQNSGAAIRALDIRRVHERLCEALDDGEVVQPQQLAQPLTV